MIRPKKPEFVRNEDGKPISRTAFRRMRNDEKRELMLRWFGENFENPVESLPYISAEGGYQWIWGGPYDAREQIEGKFADIASDRLINDVIEQLEGESDEWSPVQRDDRLEDYELPEVRDPRPLDFYTDDPGPGYDSPQAYEARERAVRALDRLDAALRRKPPVGIGHNQPPSDIDAEAERAKTQEAIGELRAELSKAEPSIALVKRFAAPLRDALVAASKWAAKKADKAADAVMTVTGAAGGTWVLGKFIPAIQNAFDAVISWLDVAAKSLF